MMHNTVTKRWLNGQTMANLSYILNVPFYKSPINVINLQRMSDVCKQYDETFQLMIAIEEMIVIQCSGDQPLSKVRNWLNDNKATIIDFASYNNTVMQFTKQVDNTNTVIFDNISGEYWMFADKQLAMLFKLTFGIAG